MYDLKRYFKNEVTPLFKAYAHEIIKKWLSQFESFEDFIKKMKLTKFVTEDFEVLDISDGNRSTIKQILSVEEVNNSLDDYLENIVLLKKYSLIKSERLL